jgi:hypothetical protein
LKSKLLDWLVTAALLALLASGCTTHELSRDI